MNIKIFVICLYLLLIYSVSQHLPDLKMIFFPALGAFSYLFISRSFHFRDFAKMIAGASVASLISSLLFLSMTGIIPFFISTLCTILLIRKFNLNAPPILAIALIPFFSRPTHFWSLPLAVLVSLLGLLLTLSAVELAVAFAARNQWIQRLRKRTGTSVDTTIDS
ncbi:hypothetical protein GC093_01260 [Paenibacillus sp. LMG 31456]|uniref:HPP family protein n=1 Tax=Paenibacillus foliorum TaxID=2654974 RepID=A0A972JZI2_9BACL|nr:hypothetical protein [Paenibacillus foliorum]NOU91868.1 hypothetical protein [Paenibacillus foliorum]